MGITDEQSVDLPLLFAEHCMSANHTDPTHSSSDMPGKNANDSPRPGNRPQKRPSADPGNMSEQLVAETLRGRESKCSHGCGSDGKGCSTGGCGVGSLVELIANKFEYTDQRRIVEVTYAGYRRGFALVQNSDLPLRVRDIVIVRNQNGIDWASVSMTGSLVHAKRKAKRLSNEELPGLLRKADENDLKRIEQCKVSEQKAFSVCKTRIESFELPMMLVGTEWQFDHKKLTFFFTADGRVDFRELVRDLAAIFNTRIELRQIPMRDAAKRLGGMGVCGRELCCTTHLGRYEHVTLDHAKIQQIPANPSKLSGQCGRLKCCLLYEVDTYVEGLKRFPPIEGTIRTEQGSGIIQKIDLFKEMIYLYYPETSSWETLSLEDYRDIAAGRKTRKQREAEEEKKRMEEEQASLRSQLAEKPVAKENKRNPEKRESGKARSKGGEGRGQKRSKSPQSKDGTKRQSKERSGEKKLSRGKSRPESQGATESQSRGRSKSQSRDQSQKRTQSQAKTSKGKSSQSNARSGPNENVRSGGNQRKGRKPQPVKKTVEKGGKDQNAQDGQRGQ